MQSCQQLVLCCSTQPAHMHCFVRQYSVDTFLRVTACWKQRQLA